MYSVNPFHGAGEVDPGAFGLAGNLDGMGKEKRHNEMHRIVRISAGQIVDKTRNS